ncbi:MAG: DUF5666 domain-containing protein [Candidatus Nomurabacteria bacterium]
MKIKKNIYSIVALSLMALTVMSPVFAETTTDKDTNQQNNIRGNRGGNRGENRGMMKPGVSGTVTSISGNIITVNGRQGFGVNTTTATVYTIDATNAKITKSNVAGTIASILIGDIISAQGTLSGTNLVATNIRDGIRGNENRQNNPNKNNPNDNGTRPTPNLNPITGNGQPVIAGTVTSVNGNTVVITNNSNINFTVDATSAKIVKGPNTILTSEITVGDVVIVQGTINGNNITASSIIDRVKQTNTTNTNTKDNQGFFGKMGSFFGHMFGF